VELLADAVHVSARQLSRLFRQETGKSPPKLSKDYGLKRQD
jgi:transcriptional regulator GlxA family with amidase domain